MNNWFRAKFPSLEMLLSLSPRELAYEIAIAMNALPPNVNWEANGIASGVASGYADTSENRRIVMEGIEMMFAMGLLTESGATGDPYVFLSRAGRALKTKEDAAAHGARNLEASALLDQRIRDAIWTPYLKGDYDIAIAYAFKRVEVEMREKAALTVNDFGERLVKRFFVAFRLPAAEDGPKPAALTPEEQLFIGAFSLYRNSASHEDITIEEPERAMEVLLIANHLLHIARSAVPRKSATATNG